MERSLVSLRHRPFLTPIWLTVCGALIGLSSLGFAAWFWGTADSTTFILVQAADAPSMAAAEARARRLAHLFGDRAAPGHLDAIYVWPEPQNRTTAAPLSEKLGVTAIVAASGGVAGWARRTLREQAGRRILIVADRDRIMELLAVLTQAKVLPSIAAGDVDTLFLVTVPRIGRADFLRMVF